MRVRVVVVLPPPYEVVARGDEGQWDPVTELALATRRDDGDLHLSFALRPTRQCAITLSLGRM
jgi:hypothetical protein